MIDKLCGFLTQKIRDENPEIDEDRAEIINYGIQLIIGEIPKIFIMISIAFLFGIGKEALISFLLIFPYRRFSGGFHLKTHIGCIICTTLMYCGDALLAMYFPLVGIAKYIAIASIWIFGMLMCYKYAPADTENLPILTKKERKQKKILSYISLTIMLVVSLLVQDKLISSIIVYGMFIQTISITRIAYRITKNQYGHEVYNKQTSNA